MLSCSCNTCELKDLIVNSIHPNDIEKFCISKTEINIPAGEMFIKQGDKIRNFKSLKSGLIKIHRTLKNGNEQIISFAKPNDFISIQNIFSESFYNYSATTLFPSTVCNINIDLIYDFVKIDGNFAKKILQVTNKESNKILYNSLDLHSKSMYGKIASVLIYFSREIFNCLSFDLPISRKEIGQYTGLSIETVIRVISEFRKDSLIKVYGKKIEICDFDQLISVYEHS